MNVDITTPVIGVANSGVIVGSGVSNRYANIIFWLSGPLA